MPFIYLLLTAIAFILGTAFGWKRATQYREFPIFQYAMMIAHTAPEEWEQKENGLHHKELGHLCEHGNNKDWNCFLSDESISKNMHNQLRNVIRDGHLRVMMKKRTERLAKETAEAVAKMNEAPRRSALYTDMGPFVSDHAQYVDARTIPYPHPMSLPEPLKKRGTQKVIGRDNNSLETRPATVVSHIVELLDGRTKRIPIRVERSDCYLGGGWPT